MLQTTVLARMAESSGKVLEGVFAITKPPSLSSAQVLRDLQQSFARSKAFKPLLEQVEQTASQNGHRSKRRKVSNDNVFKMGHGGTLDPMATGVLIVGIGRGTKHLQNFLDCTKTYETVVLFGKETNTYDVAGKIVNTAPFDHVTRQLVESKLTNFRGKVKQVPPIYSALKINGMKAYEYAREGKQIPRELEAREMEVSECTLLDWYDGGKHDFRWPAEEAPEEEKAIVQKLTYGVDAQQDSAAELPHETQESAKDQELSVPNLTKEELNTMPAEEKASLHTHTSALSNIPADAPAARIRLTVSSGFYVRSFAHDLGVLCNSFGTMAELTRTRQGQYTSMIPVPEGLIPALQYEDLGKGESLWSPEISSVLQSWMEENPVASDGQRRTNQNTQKFGRQQQRRPPRDWQDRNRNGQKDFHDRKRRNSSSPE